MDIRAVNELVKNFVLDMEIVHYNLVAVIAVVDYSFAGLVFDSRLCLKINVTSLSSHIQAY